MTIARAKYTGATPGADSNVYVLFSTVAANAPANFFAMSGTCRVTLSLSCSQNGTLKAYKSQDRGVTWQQYVADDAVVAAPTAAAFRDYVVEGLADWKLEWTNGGVAQATWLVDMALTDQRAATV
jgi:hypothetical protein